MRLGLLHLPKNQHSTVLFIIFCSKINIIFYQTFFTAILFCMGVLIDEAQEDGYFANRSSSRAREMLVVKWMLVGFMMTISYKSVLRSMMMNIEYDFSKTVDSIDDMLNSEMPMMVPSDVGNIAFKFDTDPRENIQRLKEKIVWFPVFNLTGMDLVFKGYVTCNIKHTFQPKYLNLYFRITSFSHTLVGPKGSIVGDIYGKFYASREKLWAVQQPFVVPKCSPLCVSKATLH